MLRSCVLAAVAAIVFSAIGAGGASAAVCPGHENDLYCGELTGDCLITASDALAGVRMGVGVDAGIAEADMDNGGTVTAVDALRILRIAVGTDLETDACNGVAIVTLDAEHSGFYAQNGFHQAGNYAVGWYSAPNDDELRDYFVFEMPAVAGVVTSAVLRLDTAPMGYVVYGSDDPSETYSLFHVAIPIDSLAAGTAGVAAFDDLGDGELYGSLVATSALGETVDIDLGPAAVAYLSLGSGSVAFGGAITTLTRGAGNEFLFNSTGIVQTRQLIITIE